VLGDPRLPLQARVAQPIGQRRALPPSHSPIPGDFRMSCVNEPAAVLPAAPRLHEVGRTASQLAGHVLHTPVWRWQSGVIHQQFAADTEVWLKLELLQHTGSFKLRAAITHLCALDADARRRGVVAASAGNHAMAVARAARTLGVPAWLVMPCQASPVRIAACRADGGEVLLTDSLQEALALAQQLSAQEGRTLVHPFEGPLTALGTATVGLELMQQVPGLQAVVVPVGGGGLCAGVSAVVKQLDPHCQVYGVEPAGADAMFRSFEAGRTTRLDSVTTLADSLAVPATQPYSYGVCRQFVDGIVRVSDAALCEAMAHLYRDMKLVAEPAAAASTAALLGPLRDRLRGRRVGLVVCGSNIDPARFAQLLERGDAVEAAFQ
jgi:threonine dehydratase